MTKKSTKTPHQALNPRASVPKAFAVAPEGPPLRAEAVGLPASNRELNSRGARGVPAVMASVAMAGHYLAVVEAHRRVQVALEYGPEEIAGWVENPEEPPDYDPVVWYRQGTFFWLLSAAELAKYPKAELREMMANLETCIKRHHTAMVKGYGDALRTEEKVRLTKQTRQIWAENNAWTARHINQVVSRMGGNYKIDIKGNPAGDESGVRKLLEKKSKWAVLDVEPRVYQTPKKHGKNR